MLARGNLRRQNCCESADDSCRRILSLYTHNMQHVQLFGGLVEKASGGRSKNIPTPEYRQLDDIAREPAEFEWRDLPRTHNSSTTRRGSSSWRCTQRLTRTRNAMKRCANKIQLPYQPVQNYFWKDVGLSSDQETKKNGTGLCPSNLAGNGTQQQKK